MAIKNACNFCGKEASNVCERCGDEYCSEECQQFDWKAHRYICMPLPELVRKSGRNANLYENLPELVEFKKNIEHVTTCIASDNSSFSTGSLQFSSDKINNNNDDNKSLAASIQSEREFMEYFKKRALNIYQSNVNIVVDVDRFAGKNVELYILNNSHINKGYLTCLLAKDLGTFDKMDKQINKLMKQRKEKISFIPNNGLYCMVKSIDGGWYRAICSSFNRNNTVSVLFLDFGYEESVTLSQIYQLDNKLAYPCISVTCYIEGIPTDKTDEMYRKNFFTKLANIFIPFSKIIFDKVVPDQKMKIAKCHFSKVFEL